MDPRLRTPCAHQASVGFEQAVGPEMTVSANAIVVRGTHQLGLIDYTPSNPALGSPIRRPNDVGGVGGTSAPVLQFTSFGDTWYRGATVSLQKRGTGGNHLLAAYTVSSSEDNATDFQGDLLPQSMGFGRNPADPSGLPRGFDPSSERGPSVWERAPAGHWPGAPARRRVTDGAGGGGWRYPRRPPPRDLRRGQAVLRALRTLRVAPGSDDVDDQRR